jgi:hypothetical protein
MDSLFTRAGYVAGIGPRQLLNTSYWDQGGEGRGRGPWGVDHASPMLLDMAAAAWDAVSKINSELLALMPAIFATTSKHEYNVSFMYSQEESSNTSATPIRTLRKHIHADGHRWNGHDIIIAV